MDEHGLARARMKENNMPIKKYYLKHASYLSFGVLFWMLVMSFTCFIFFCIDFVLYESVNLQQAYITKNAAVFWHSSIYLSIFALILFYITGKYLVFILKSDKNN